jgi:hypothetical protein
MAEGSTDNPFKLGPFQNMTKVHWGPGGGIIVVEIHQHRENINASFGFTIIPAFGEFSESTPLMPFIAGGEETDLPPDLDLKEMLVLSGHANPWEPPSSGGDDGGSTDVPTPPDWDTLMFFNLRQFGSNNDTEDGFIVGMTFPAVPKTDEPSDTQFGYYIWLSGGGIPGTHDASYVPRHPAPDATNAFLPYPFDDVQGILTYIALWNSIGSTWDPATAARWADYGVPLPPLPSRGAYGWRSAAEAQQYCDGILAFQNADIDRAIEINAGNPDGDDRSDYQTPLEFTPLTIDFGAPPDPPKPKLYTADIRALYYQSRVNFPYDSANGQQWPDPATPKDIGTRSIVQAPDTPIRSITITYDKTNGVVIT